MLSKVLDKMLFWIFRVKTVYLIPLLSLDKNMMSLNDYFKKSPYI